MKCPNCLASMTQRSFERLYGRSMTLDLCHACQGIWFDDQELLQLSPGATLELLSAIAGESGAARQPLKTSLTCPRCARTLVETHDAQRNTRFWYSRCPEGHGRYLAFFQFLRAKNFVRALAAHEIEELRAHIRQVNCANCGAPIDVEQGAVCGFCRTPIAMLDPDQVRKAVAHLQKAGEGKKQVDPTLPMTLLIERVRAERAFLDDTPRSARPSITGLLAFDSADLVSTGLRSLRGLFGGD